MEWMEWPGDTADGAGKLGVYAVGRLSSLPLNRLHMLMCPPRTEPEGFGEGSEAWTGGTDRRMVLLSVRYALCSFYPINYSVL